MEPVQGFQRNLPFEDEPPEAPTYPGTPGCCSSRAWHPCTGPSGQDSAAPTHPGWKARPHPWRSLIPVRANPSPLAGGFSLMWLSGKGFNQELAETCGTVSTEGAGFLWEGKHFLRVSKGRAFIRLCFPLWRKRPRGKDTLPLPWDFTVAAHFVQNIFSHLHQTATALPVSPPLWPIIPRSWLQYYVFSTPPQLFPYHLCRVIRALPHFTEFWFTFYFPHWTVNSKKLWTISTSPLSCHHVF